jgi:hypothetical protein
MYIMNINHNDSARIDSSSTRIAGVANGMNKTMSYDDLRSWHVNKEQAQPNS